MYTAKAFTLVLSALGALASPVSQPEKRDSAPTTQQVTWKNPAGGNLQLGWADSGLKFGSQKPSDIIRNNVSSTCSTIGTCIGNNAVSVPSSQIVDGDAWGTLDISYTVTGAYPTWVHNGLIDMLAWAMDNQTKITNNVCATTQSTAVCAGTTGGDFCSGHTDCYDQYEAPGAVAVALPDPNDPNADPNYITLEFSTKEEGGTDLCSDMTTLGSGLAGFIGDASGPVGGIFTLASLFCQIGSS